MRDDADRLMSSQDDTRAHLNDAEDEATVLTAALEGKGSTILNIRAQTDRVNSELAEAEAITAKISEDRDRIQLLFNDLTRPEQAARYTLDDTKSELERMRSVDITR